MDPQIQWPGLQFLKCTSLVVITMTQSQRTPDPSPLRGLKHCLILIWPIVQELRLGMAWMQPHLSTQVQGMYPEEKSSAQMRVKDILTQVRELKQSPPLIREENILSTVLLHLLFLKTSEEDPGKDIKFLFTNLSSQHLFHYTLLLCMWGIHQLSLSFSQTKLIILLYQRKDIWLSNTERILKIFPLTLCFF